tara:strand:+ start:115 stop:384 length:270 start_codon:yes stop_codon:yes gene_type:complete
MKEPEEERELVERISGYSYGGIIIGIIRRIIVIVKGERVCKRGYVRECVFKEAKVHFKIFLKKILGSNLPGLLSAPSILQMLLRKQEVQ